MKRALKPVRPAAPRLVARGGAAGIPVRIQNYVEGHVDFLDAVKHYPPLHMLTRRYRVYEAYWRSPKALTARDITPGDNKKPWLAVVEPTEILLLEPYAASLLLLSYLKGRRRRSQRCLIPFNLLNMVKAFGYLGEKCSNRLGRCGYTYLEDYEPGARDVRAVIVVVDASVYEEYASSMLEDHRRLLEPGRAPRLSRNAICKRKRLALPWPYLQPVTPDGKCVYRVPRWAYGVSDVVYPLANLSEDERDKCKKAVVDETKRILKSMTSKHQIDIPNLNPWPRLPTLVAVTPPKFMGVLGDRPYIVTRLGEARLKLGAIQLSLRPVIVEAHVYLDYVRSYIAGRVVTVNISFKEGSRLIKFGTTISTQGLQVEIDAAKPSIQMLEKIFDNVPELRSKLLYHAIYRLLSRATRRRGLMLKEEELQYAAYKTWKAARLLTLLEGLARKLNLKNVDSDTIADVVASSTLFNRNCPLGQRLNYRLQLLEGTPSDRVAAAAIATLLKEVAGLENSTRSNVFLRYMEELHDEDHERLLSLYKWFSEGRPLHSLRDLVEEYVEEALRHTIFHWVMALYERYAGAIHQLRLREQDGLVYELVNGGSGASWALPRLLAAETASAALEWAYVGCTAHKYVQQTSAILSNPTLLGRTWRLRDNNSVGKLRQELRLMLGDEPVDSVVYRLSAALADTGYLLRLITIRSLAAIYSEALGAPVRPDEMASAEAALAQLNVLEHVEVDIASRIQELFDKAGIHSVDIKKHMSEALRRLRTSKHPLVTYEEAEEDTEEITCRSMSTQAYTLAMEEAGLLYYDASPICHTVRGCRREYEEDSVVKPLAYLSTTLLSLYAGGGGRSRHAGPRL